MVSVQKLSFKSESNLLNKAVSQMGTQTLTKDLNNTAPQKEGTPKQESSDKFVKETPATKKQELLQFIKEYSGIGALALSITAIPLTYAITKKRSKKNISKLEQNITELTQKINTLIENKPKPTPEQISPKSSRLTTILLGIGTGLGIGEFIKNNKKDLKEMGYSEEDIENAKTNAIKMIEAPQKASQAANIAISTSQRAEQKINDAHIMAQEAKNSADSADWRINEARDTANAALYATGGGIRPEMQNYIEKYYDLSILKYPNWQKKINNLRTNEAKEAILNASNIRLHRPAEGTIKAVKNYKERYKDSLTSLWSLTAEYKPVKLGGLGDVPADLQDNFTKLGIDNPTFIPMYETPGVSKFIDEEDSKTYIYNKNVFNLEKLATMEIEVFKNGGTEFQPVEFYLNQSNGKNLIFVRNKNFKGGIYESTKQSSEPEKFAIFDKAVYNLAKVKVAEALNEPYSGDTYIKKYEAYDKLKAPNSMILNDWHAGAIAGLLRYKAPLEYNYNELNKETFKALSHMPLLMIGHNLKVQGASNSGEISLVGKNNVTQNVINTLYDQYALQALEHSYSGLTSSDDLAYTILLKRKTGDKQFNPLFHGIALSDWFVPVSKNYSKEIVEDVMQSGIAKPLLEARYSTGTIGGIINGTDLTKHNMNKVAKNNYVNGLNLMVYDKNNDIDTIMQYRKENKRRFFNAFLVPLLNGKSDKPELVNKNSEIQNINEEDFISAPLLSFAHRLTDQKGLALLKPAIIRLFDSWEEEFGNKPKPYFIVGGPPESNKEVNYLYELADSSIGTDQDRLSHIFVMKGNMPNPAIMSASTYFCAPSTFEPCGLTQGECFAKGTPVIATDTGGYHDTIEDGKTGFLAPQINEDALYNTIVKALHVYFDEQDTYKKMIMNDLNVDFSWARKDRKGPIYEYTEKLGFDNNKLPDIAG